MAARLACRGDTTQADDLYASGTLVKGGNSMSCIQCGYEIPHVFGTCPNCGRPAETVPGRPGNRRNARSVRRQPLRLDANRWTQNDRIAGAGSAILLISLFLPWFGITVFGTSVTEDGLTSHGYLSIVMITCLAILGYLVLRISPARPVLPPSRMHELLLLAATAVNFALVVTGFIATPGGASWAPLLSRQFGSFVGAAAALAAVAPLAKSVFNIQIRL
jgi:hypothetical protein